MKIVLKLISSLLSLFITTQSCHAGMKTLATALNEYQYAMKVEWDQSDLEFSRKQEAILLNDIEVLLKQGTSAQEILNESLNLIKNDQTRIDFRNSLAMYDAKSMTPEQLRAQLLGHIDEMQSQGASWSPVTKVVVGVVIGYAVLKALMLVIYYWDTDPNYGQTDTTPPPKP